METFLVVVVYHHPVNNVTCYLSKNIIQYNYNSYVKEFSGFHNLSVNHYCQCPDLLICTLGK